MEVSLNRRLAGLRLHDCRYECRLAVVGSGEKLHTDAAARGPVIAMSDFPAVRATRCRRQERVPANQAEGVEDVAARRDVGANSRT
jgi:hypothetical protein